MKIGGGIVDHTQLTGVVAGQHQAEAVAATQAAMEAETAQQTFARPDRVRFSPGVAKGWCRLTDAGALVAGSYNIGSISDLGVGSRQINISDAFSSVDFVAVSTCATDAGAGNEPLIAVHGSFGTDSVRLLIYQATARIDRASSTVLFGDQ